MSAWPPSQWCISVPAHASTALTPLSAPPHLLTATAATLRRAMQRDGRLSARGPTPATPLVRTTLPATPLATPPQPSCTAEPQILAKLMVCHRAGLVILCGAADQTRPATCRLTGKRRSSGISRRADCRSGQTTAPHCRCTEPGASGGWWSGCCLLPFQFHN